MKILALNTSFNNTYVVAVNNDKTAEYQIDSKLKQSENVLEIIDKALKEVDLEIKNLDAIACVIGPGSFTGIRIGLALTKGFLQPFKNIKFIAINSFELMLKEARAKQIEGDLTCVINALSGKFFVQSFDKNDKALIDGQMVQDEKINQLIGTTVSLKEENLTFTNKHIDFTLDVLKQIVVDKFNENNFTEVIEPMYIRKSQAEDDLDKKRNNND